MKNIVLFASGTGTNAEKIIQYFQHREDVNVKAIFSNRKNAGVHNIAKKHQIPSTVFTREQFYNSEYVIDLLHDQRIDLIVLAGFLWLIPKNLIDKFPNRIINIHPALLPKYGGQGMYGMNVHRAVSQSGDEETGITVHLVNHEYDEGRIISQIRCLIKPNDSAENIAQKVQKVEHRYFPMIIDRFLENKYFSKKV